MNDMTIGGFGNGGQTQTMSSREIATVCEKRHRDVLRDIRVMLDALKDGADLRHVRETKDPRGYTEQIFLDRNLTMTLVSGYNVILRNRIVQRLAEYEDAAKSAMVVLPTDYPSALRALAEKAEAEQRLLDKVEQDAPKVAFADQVEVAPDAISMGEAAKIAGTGRTRLSALLKQKGWLTRYGEPYQSKIDAGYLDVKISSFEHPREGLKSRVTPLVTGKGLSRIVKMVRDEGLGS